MNYSYLKAALENHPGKKNPSFAQKVTATKLPIYGLYTKDIAALTKEYKDIDLDSFVLDESYEANLIYFSIALKRLKRLDKQIDFILRKAEHIDSWAITDTTYQSIEKRPFEEALPYIKKLLSSMNPFAVRYGYLMFFFYKRENPERLFPLFKDHENYYVKMVEAWILAELCIYSFDKTYEYLSDAAIDSWIKKKAIAKARESFRVSEDNKAKLLALRDSLN